METPHSYIRVMYNVFCELKWQLLFCFCNESGSTFLYNNTDIQMLSTKWWSSSLHISVVISGWVQCWLWTDMCLFSMEAVMVIGIWNMMLLGNLYCHTEWWIIVHWSLYIPWNMRMICWAVLPWLCFMFLLIDWVYLPIFSGWLTKKTPSANWMHNSLNVLYELFGNLIMMTMIKNDNDNGE